MVYENSSFDESKFWSRVDKTGNCWLWTGADNGDGYGNVRYYGPAVGAHRVAYSLSFGTIPAGLCVCHTCDTRRCVRPDHLFLGTNADNVRDKVRKGRTYRGGHPLEANAKVLKKGVLAIHKMYARRIHVRVIAAKFGISVSHTYAILNGGRRTRLPP